MWVCPPRASQLHTPGIIQCISQKCSADSAISTFLGPTVERHRISLETPQAQKSGRQALTPFEVPHIPHSKKLFFLPSLT